MTQPESCDGAACESTARVAAVVAPAPAGSLAFRVTGMDCVDEVSTLKRVLAPIVDVNALTFDVLAGRMTVSAPVDRQAIVDAVAQTGMRAEDWFDAPTPDSANAPSGRFSRRDWLVVGSVVATAAGFATHAGLAGWTAAIGSEGAGLAETVPLGVRAIYGVGIVCGLWVVLPKAWFALRTFRPDMNLLMTIAVAGAVIIGEWFEAATVSALFALSLALEAWSVGRARRAVEALMRLAPDTVRLVGANGDTSEVDPASVPVGALFVVKPGERIGLDGTVKTGRTDVDQSPITGESMPVDKQPGDEVFAGTINGAGVIEVETTKAAGETTLARIVRQVADSQANRAQTEQFVERFARVYTPAILALAIAVALVPPLLLGADLDAWTYRALVLLVIGCPCALVISTPVAIVAALASAARHGVLLKGGRVAELPARIAVIALDKTGTLTHGRPQVEEVIPLAEHDERALIERAAALEQLSGHPIAAAILRRAQALNIDVPAARDVTGVVGKGVEGFIHDRPFWLGSHRWLEERGLETPAIHQQLDQLSSAGRSVVVVGNQDHLCGFIAVGDGVRPESQDAVQSLRDAGVERVVMLTGDNRATADAVGRAVGVDEVRAELLPEDKVAAVETLEQQVGPTAMIGDGINDAPALARATLGIAMGAAGTDAAIETADVALMSDDLSKLAWLVAHSRATLRIIRANIGLALGIKAVFVVLTLGGWATLWGAVAADMGASLIVVMNALRLLRR